MPGTKDEDQQQRPGSAGSAMMISKAVSFKRHLSDVGADTLPSGASADLQQLAYNKESDEEQKILDKKILHRIFKSIDVGKTGHLREDDIATLFNMTGEGSLTAEELAGIKNILFKNGSPDFDTLWESWEELKLREHSAKEFKLISSRFDESFSQHQLLIEEEGEQFTPTYRIFFYLKNLKTEKKIKISPWHDIPLFVKDVVRTTSPEEPLNKYNFICEIPKWTRAKYEIATKETFNPIKQDVDKGALRFYKHGDMLFNYGAFPQTWESTTHSFVFTDEGEAEAYPGDNDPVDAIEIGTQQLGTGSVTPVKVLGALGMIDDGEMDWKVICINITDPLAMFISDISDVARHMPGALECLRSWLRDYKICTGKPQNKFACEGNYFERKYAQDVISECHNHWRNFHLIHQKTEAA